MSNIITIVENWPVIIQGALGSALFAITLFVFQKTYKFVSHKVSSLSKKSRISELNTEKLKLATCVFKGQEKAIIAAPILYRMSRPLIKALLWLVLGMMFGQIISVFTIIGYIGCIYYLVKALDIVSVYEFNGDPEAKLSEINAEIEELKNDA